MSNDAAHAKAFTSMAEELARNAENPFGGAFVIAPPDGDAQVGLFLGNSVDVSMFWGTILTIAQREVALLDDRARQSSMFQGVR